MARGFVSGGRKLRAWARKAQAARTVKVEVGFLGGDKYPDEVPVAAVARAHEFGLGNVRERPFMRRAVAAEAPELRREIHARMKGRQAEEPLQLTGADAEALGQRLADGVRRSIVDYRDPDGTPRLVDTGKMLGSVRHRVTWEGEGDG